MSQQYEVYPIPTVNIPAIHPGVRFQNYELYLGDGDLLDVRTRCYDLNEPEIVLAQVLNLDGEVVGHIPFNQITLSDIE